MPLPERLKVWMQEEDGWNQRIICALMHGVVAGVMDLPLGQRAAELDYASRSALGDAFEEGRFFGEDHREDGGRPLKLEEHEVGDQDFPVSEVPCAECGKLIPEDDTGEIPFCWDCWKLFGRAVHETGPVSA